MRTCLPPIAYPLLFAYHVLMSKEHTGSKKRSPKPQNTARSSITGILSVTARGFGFVQSESGEKKQSEKKNKTPDIFIPLENMGTAMDGDTVSVEIIREVKGKNPVGRVVKVLEPATRDIVGIYHSEGKRERSACVVPEDERFKRNLVIPADKRSPKGGKKPADGQIVLVRREKWDDPKQDPKGRVIEILGSPEDPEIDTLVIAKSKGLRTEFPGKAMETAKNLGVPNLKKEKKRRLDLRDTLCFTIDPESAEDFDDAVSLVQLDNGKFELGVHIADVSYYVTENSPLDKEAMERGTSVYFVDSVIPMLPEKLSNELCSLREKEDRLAYSVLMEVDSRGNITGYRIAETIIRSDRRFTYREVEDIIEGKDSEKNSSYRSTISLMTMLSLVLRKAREERGSIDFDVPVPVISLDNNGIPFEVSPSERLEANRLVEEFMLAANLTVARHIVGLNKILSSRGGKKRGGGKRVQPGATATPGALSSEPAPLPFVYRVHEKPDENEVEAFLDLLQRLGIKYRIPGELEPEDYRKILDIIENLEFKDFAEKVALRSMTKAVYSTDNIGHFGLAFDAYTHFTSPIRRYPDLLVHRLLKHYTVQVREKQIVDTGKNPLEKKISRKIDVPPKSYKKELEKTCEQCSEREIRAVDAEREHSKVKAMEFLSNKVGETYEGMISGITSFGFFVELNHYLIEGLVHVSELKDDHYEFDKDNYTLTGERTGTTYRLGDPIKVTIKNVSVDERKADFVRAS